MHLSRTQNESAKIKSQLHQKTSPTASASSSSSAIGGLGPSAFVAPLPQGKQELKQIIFRGDGSSEISEYTSQSTSQFKKLAVVRKSHTDEEKVNDHLLPQIQTGTHEALMLQLLRHLAGSSLQMILLRLAFSKMVRLAQFAQRLGL